MTTCILEFKKVYKEQKPVTEFIKIVDRYLSLAPDVPTKNDSSHLDMLDEPQWVGNCWLFSPATAATAGLMIASKKFNVPVEPIWEVCLSFQSMIQVDERQRN